MKKLKLITLICVAFFGLTFNSCKKKVTGDNLVWVGVWKNDEGTERLTINSNGSGMWEQASGYSTKSISGKTKFSSSKIVIKATLFKKEFSIGERPKEVALSQFYSETQATLNGQIFILQ